MVDTSVNIEDNKQQTQQTKEIQQIKKKVNLEALKEKISQYNLFISFDLFYLSMTWFFLVCQKDSEINFAATSFAWYVSLVFILDLMFRLLSVRIESINPNNWNHLWLCLFPVVFTMLAGFYDYKEAVYGSGALQVWNALFYTCYMVGIMVCAVYHKFLK